MIPHNTTKVEESLKAAEYIVAKSQHVTISNKNLVNMACNIRIFWEDNNLKSVLTNVFFRPKSFVNLGETITVDWLFVFHTLNFSLFNPKDTKQWIVGNESGYFALAFAIKRAIDEGKPLWNPKYYTTLKLREFKLIFRGDDGKTNIPLVKERYMIFREVGITLLKYYKGTFAECVKASNYDADQLVKLLFDRFLSYRDEAIYDGIKVRLYTKAKSLVSDIWACYRRNNAFHLNKQNMMSTMFIDYRAPIVLYHFGVICYSAKLMEKFNKGNEPLEYGSMEELEIRACSLVAANRMLKFIEARWRENSSVNQTFHSASILIDNFILGFIDDKFHTCLYNDPFHYIKSMYY